MDSPKPSVCNLDPAFVGLLEKLHAVELEAERLGYWRFADFMHEHRAIAREHMDGYYTKQGNTEYNVPAGVTITRQERPH